MTYRFKEGVLETSTVVGTTNISLDGRNNGNTFSSFLEDGDTTYYEIRHALNGDYEIGLGTYNKAYNFISRNTVYKSSNNNQTVKFVAGLKTVTSVEVAIDTAVNKSKLPLDSRLVTEGDSLTDYENSNLQNWQFYFGLFTKSRFYRPQNGNQAVGGQKISGLLLDATYMSDATQIAAVRAQKPDVVTLMGGTNDIAGGVTDYNGLFAALLTAVNGYFAVDSTFSGAKYVIVGKVPPRNPTTDLTWSAAKELVRVNFNRLIDTLPSLDYRILVAQTDSDNAAGSYDLTSANTTHQSDGVHESWKGFRIIGFAFAVEALKIIDSAVPTNFYSQSDNLATNPALYGVGGSMSGNVPSGVPVPTGVVADSWTVANNMNGVDIACSKDTLNGAVAQKMVLSGTAGGGGQLCQFQQNVTYSGQIGEGYELMCDYELSNFSNLKNVYMSCDTSQTPNGSSTTVFANDQTLSGVLRTKLTAPLSGIDTTNQIRIYAQSNAAGAITATIKISKPYLRKITAASPQ